MIWCRDLVCTSIRVAFVVFQVTAHETFSWIPVSSDTHTLPAADELRNWMRIGPKKMDISGETEFVSLDTLNSVLSVRVLFLIVGLHTAAASQDICRARVSHTCSSLPCCAA